MPASGDASTPYEWEIVESRPPHALRSHQLKIFTDDGDEFTRVARFPRFLTNYISLDSMNTMGTDEVFRDNTVLFISQHECIMQNTWFTGPEEYAVHGRFFLDGLPTMRSVKMNDQVALN
jgi:hypothetical protein